jgi:hypothetical protein
MHLSRHGLLAATLWAKRSPGVHKRMHVSNLGVTTFQPRAQTAVTTPSDKKEVRADAPAHTIKPDSRSIIDRVREGYKSDRDFQGDRRPATRHGAFLCDGIWFRLPKQLHGQIIVPDAWHFETTSYVQHMSRYRLFGAHRTNPDPVAHRPDIHVGGGLYRR